MFMGIDGGGPPPGETGVGQAPKIDPQIEKAEIAPLSGEVIGRKAAVLEILNNPRLEVFKNQEGFEGIYQSWVEDLRADVDPAIMLSAAAGFSQVEIDTAYDASTEFGSTDERFAGVFLPSFNAHATIGNDIENVSVLNFTELIKNPGIRKVQQEKEGEVPEFEGTGVVVDSEGKALYLVAETDIPGVRIVLKGTSVLIPDHPGSRMKMSLLIDLKDGSTPAEQQEEQDLLTTIQEIKDQRAQEVAQLSDTDLNNRIFEFRTSIEQLVVDPSQKEFFINLVEGLRNKDRSEVTKEQLQLIDMAIGKSVASKEERKKLRGILGILLVAVVGMGKDALGASGLTKTMPQQGR